MKIFRIIAVISLILFLSGSFTATLFAQDENKPVCNKADNDEPGTCCGVSNLSKEQIEKIDVLHQVLVKESMDLKNQIAEKKAHLRTVSTGDNADQNAINTTIDEMFALRSSLLKKEFAFKQEVRKLLDDKQKVEFDMNRNGRNGRKKGHGNYGKGKCGSGFDHHGGKCNSEGSCGNKFDRHGGKCRMGSSHFGGGKCSHGDGCSKGPGMGHGGGNCGSGGGHGKSCH